MDEEVFDSDEEEIAEGSDDEYDPVLEKNNPLDWWRENEHLFPNIARLAKSLLAIPATSASSERVFSVAGLVCSKNRARLSAVTVANIVFMHGFYRFMETNPDIILPMSQ